MLKPARPSPADRDARQRPSHSPSPAKLVPPRAKPRPTQGKGKPPMDTALVRTQASASSTSSAQSWLAQKLPPFTSEQYWAVRAMRAEALLAARVDHDRELKSVVFSADVRRTREISALQQVHHARQRRLEYIVILSLACTAILLAGAFVHFAWSGAPPKAPPPPPKRFASHFTIPILSPFTSVIEHEMSVMGAKTIVACFIVLVGPVVYFVLRHWQVV